MRTHQYAHKKRASQSFRTPVSRPTEVQSSVQPPQIQARSNEEGLAEHAERLKKFQRLGSSMIQMGPPRLDNNTTNSVQPKPWIQRKLTIGQPGDKYEQEADRVASQVVQQINAPKENNLRQSIQREKDLEGVMQAKGFRAAIQRHQAMSSREASPDLESAINSARSSGQPLDARLQQSMGQAMGADFSGMRVHTDAQSDQLNQSIQAKAFTTGQDVFFREGAYQPDSGVGQELIAHELTHVVQQNGKNIVQSHVAPHQYLLNTSLSRSVISQKLIQRDINGQQEYDQGWLKIDFSKTADADNSVVGEAGDITFFPKFFGPPLQKIYLEQSTRSTRMERDEKILKPEDPKLWDMTVRGGENEGYYADNVPTGLGIKEKENPSTFKEEKDAKTLHYYINAGMESEKDSSPNLKGEKGDNYVGSRSEKEIVPARLHDTPKHFEPIKYDFLTSALELAKGARLGHVSWGFEIKAKNAKENEVANEYIEFKLVEDKDANTLQDLTRNLFYEALEKTQWKKPVTPDKPEGYYKKEAVSERNVYAIFRMTEFQEAFGEKLSSVEELKKKIIDMGEESPTWEFIYETLIELFPSGKKT